MLLFEDLLIVPLLAIVAFIAPVDAAQQAIAPSRWIGIGIAVGALAALVAAGIWLLNPLFRVLANSKAREVMTAAALLVVLGAALLMQVGGLSMAMGAFLAGVLLSNRPSATSSKPTSNPSAGFCWACSSSAWACRSTSRWWRRTGSSSSRA